ncbi:MAG: Amino acid/polyamine/organocation transporter, superfamily, partial [Rhizorhabdus sp.]|nr:Amino acid/polyamine/organocation transporter, superfamily [Rhizorhabdus sp.]
AKAGIPPIYPHVMTLEGPRAFAGVTWEYGCDVPRSKALSSPHRAEEAVLTDTVAEQEIARDRGLLRAVGTWGLAASIVNGVVGAGIFSLPAAMTLAAGDRAPLAYIICAIAMTAVVICFAEASSRVPTSGGSYGYVEAAFGPLAGFVAGVLMWLSSVLACGGIAAAMAAGIGELVPAIANPVVRSLLILIVIGGLAWVNIRGVAPAARFIGVITLIKLLPLLLFIVVGGVALLHLPASAAGPPGSADGFGRAVILALFAFCGMETPLGVSGEVSQPQRTIPRALFLSMSFVVILYIALQLIAQGLLGAKLGEAPTPLADAIAVVSPGMGLVLLVGASVSRLGWIASDIFGAPRVLFAFARDRLLPAGLAAVHPRTRTPHVAIIVHSVLAALFAITGTFEQLAILSALATAGLYFLSCAAAWRLSRSGVAVFGKPLGFRGLPVFAILGMVSMVVLVALAEWSEIIGLVLVILGSALFFYVNGLQERRLGRVGR